jgi:hypothetical protein
MRIKPRSDAKSFENDIRGSNKKYFFWQHLIGDEDKLERMSMGDDKAADLEGLVVKEINFDYVVDPETFIKCQGDIRFFNPQALRKESATLVDTNTRYSVLTDEPSIEAVSKMDKRTFYYYCGERDTVCDVEGTELERDEDEIYYWYNAEKAIRLPEPPEHFHVYIVTIFIINRDRLQEVEPPPSDDPEDPDNASN